MKNFVKFLTTIPALSLLFFTGRAQPGISAGISAANAKTLTISYDFKTGKKNYAAVFYQRYGYNEQHWPLNLKTSRTVNFFGAQYMPQLLSSRNRTARYLIGGAAGSLQGKLQYYAHAGLQHNWFCRPGCCLFLSGTLQYLFTQDNHWQPFLNTGIKFSLR